MELFRKVEKIATNRCILKSRIWILQVNLFLNQFEIPFWDWSCRFWKFGSPQKLWLQNHAKILLLLETHICKIKNFYKFVFLIISSITNAISPKILKMSNKNDLKKFNSTKVITWSIFYLKKTVIFPNFSNIYKSICFVFELPIFGSKSSIFDRKCLKATKNHICKIFNSKIGRLRKYSYFGVIIFIGSKI